MGKHKPFQHLVRGGREGPSTVGTLRSRYKSFLRRRAAGTDTLGIEPESRRTRWKPRHVTFSYIEIDQLKKAPRQGKEETFKFEAGSPFFVLKKKVQQIIPEGRAGKWQKNFGRVEKDNFIRTSTGRGDAWILEQTDQKPGEWPIGELNSATRMSGTQNLAPRVKEGKGGEGGTIRGRGGSCGKLGE